VSDPHRENARRRLLVRVGDVENVLHAAALTLDEHCVRLVEEAIRNPFDRERVRLCFDLAKEAAACSDRILALGLEKEATRP